MVHKSYVFIGWCLVGVRHVVSDPDALLLGAALCESRNLSPGLRGARSFPYISILVLLLGEKFLFN